LQLGPYGGGNAFVKNLSKSLTELGHDVRFDLLDSDLDFIIITDPRTRSPNVAFGAGETLDYLRRYQRTLVIHRINECDERKGTSTMNMRLRAANYCADHTVFVGSWLKDLDLMFREKGRSSSVILNGVDTSLFNSHGYSTWDGVEPLRLVTHHWGNSWNKGFDVYQRLDLLLDSEQWRRKIDFTFVGNLPAGFSFRYARHIPPLKGFKLAQELRSHHVYLTASINEPGGNHQVEGGACGLPLLYRNSGCMPEYCEGFGVMFDGENIEAALIEIINRYIDYQRLMITFPHTWENRFSEWLALFDWLELRREKLIADRRRRLVYEFLNRLPI